MKAGYNVFVSENNTIYFRNGITIFKLIKLLVFLPFFGSIKSYKVRKLLGGVCLKRGTQNTIY